MIDILEKLRKDFPEHLFEIENVSAGLAGEQNLLKIDGIVANIQWATMEENMFLTIKIQEDLYEAVKKNVKKYLEKTT